MPFEANHLLVIQFYQSYVVNWHVHTIEQCLRQKNTAWVDAYSYELTHFSYITRHESTQDIMSRYILLSRPKTERQKVHESTQNTNVSTQTRNDSTHTIMYWLILSWFCFFRNKKWHVSMHKDMCQYIKFVFLSLYTIFLFIFLLLFIYSIWL